jgi:hypothetical protein
MAEPSQKSPEMQRILDALTEELFGKKRTQAIVENECVTCHGSADSFRDSLSRKEFTISGMCQKCQDGVFGTKDE